ncbi:MAG: CRISPR-associated helicase Cas3' [Acidobacteria bacterium]|nr:CRISPR-associated helicase Cas3' [Acidobacteriota bacterium]
MSTAKPIAHVRELDQTVQSLDAHLLAVAGLARANASKLCSGGSARQGIEAAGELLGLVHDLGKYSSEFQNYIRSAAGLLDQDTDEDARAAGLRGTIDHSTAGAQLIWRELSGVSGMGGLAGQILALCVASHHSGLIDCLTPQGQNEFGRRIGKSSDRTFHDEVIASCDAEVMRRVMAILHSRELVEAIRTTLEAICNSSSAKGNRLIQQQQIGLLVRFLFSCVVDADRADTASFERGHLVARKGVPNPPEWAPLAERLEAHIADLTPKSPIDAVRKEISRHCLEAAHREKGLHTLTVPTGGGKTLASLRFALHHAAQHGMHRVIYAIPYTSIIDQNAEVARQILDPEGMRASRGRVVLEHHSNLTPETQSWHDKRRCESWDAPVVFTTNVQVLEALFGAGTRGARRMHQLARAVIIFDEIQTLPVRCVHLFNNAISFLVEQCGSTVLLCTATQPLLQGVDHRNGAMQVRPGCEIMPNVAELFARLRRVDVVSPSKAGGWANEEIAELAVDECKQAESCLVVVNTKAMAADVFGKVRERTQIPVAHLSTNMCPAHRKRVLRIIRHRLLHRKPILCVSTQLIEAGVDVDFGSVVRCTAGLDSIAQAAGRCNRHGERGVGKVHVVKAREERLSSLVDLRLGQEKAERVLADFKDDPGRYDNDLLGPAAMSWYFENYFFARATEMAYPVSAAEVGRDDTLLNMLSANTLATHDYCQRHPGASPPHLRQAFATAAKAFEVIDAPTRGVVVPYGREGRRLVAELCGAVDPERQFSLLRSAQQFTVGVFPGMLQRLGQAGAVHPIQTGSDIFFLDPCYYSPEFGLTNEPVGRMEVLLS